MTMASRELLSGYKYQHYHQPSSSSNHSNGDGETSFHNLSLFNHTLRSCSRIHSWRIFRCSRKIHSFLPRPTLRSLTLFSASQMAFEFRPLRWFFRQCTLAFFFFLFPMAFTTTMLSWSVIEFGNAMPTQIENARAAIRWGVDYLLKAATTAAPETLYVQVGDPNQDHRCWERPEDMDTPRNVYKVTPQNPGSDVAGETAAALAAAAIVFKDSDPPYSSRLLHAWELKMTIIPLVGMIKDPAPRFFFLR